MLTYQVRPRVFKLRNATKPPSFPAEVEVNFYLLPQQAFGTVTTGGRTLTQSVPGGLFFNLNTGQHSAKSDRPLGALRYRKDLTNGHVELRGNIVTRVLKCPDYESLLREVQLTYFILPSLLGVRFADPPYVERIDGKIAGTPFTWELEKFLGASQVTNKQLQQERFALAWNEMERLEAKDRRLVAAVTYFHTGCRLLREARTPGEFLAEALLNFAKVLETLFPGPPDKTRESVKAGLRAFGLGDQEIDRDLIPVLLLRSQFDVAHVSLAILTVDQATTLQRYAERAEHVLAKFLDDLLRRVSEGTFEIVPYNDSGLDQNYARTIERLKEHLDSLGDRP